MAVADAYAVGDAVEVYCPDTQQWCAGFVTETDPYDEEMPVRVLFEKHHLWTRISQVRHTSVPPQAPRYEYRVVTIGDGIFVSSSTTEWTPLELGGETSIALSGSLGQRNLEIRQMPARSAEEIVAELRKAAHSGDYSVSIVRLRSILDGDF